MTTTAIVQLTLKVSFSLTALCIGLNARPRDAMYLLRRPGMLLCSIASMNVAMPLAAIFLAVVLPLHPAVKIALVALSASPIPILFTERVTKAGKQAYAVSLFVIVTALSFIVAPLTLWVMGAWLGVGFHVPPMSIARTMWLGALLPLGVGVLVRTMLPALGEKLAGPVGNIGKLGLLLAAIPIFIVAWKPMMGLVGDGTLLAFVLFGVCGVTVGHLLGGPEQHQRIMLALATATRHPGIAVGIAAALFPEQKLVPAAVILNLLVSFALTTIYERWANRSQVVPVGAAPSTP
jgi:BASS family bile acid:Na+ symporter